MYLRLFIVWLVLTGNLVVQNAMAQDPVDCIHAIEICTDAVINENSNGFGVDDFSSAANSSGCLGHNPPEHQSVWLYIQIAGGNHLGFDLRPVNSGPLEDYDFAVYGPNVSCDNLGEPIRCSFANSACASCPFTGMDATSTDISEPFWGDGYVKWLDINAGDSYYILIDNFASSDSGFILNWTGDAILDCSVTLPCPIVDLGPDTSFCDGESIEIGMPFYPIYTYQWNNGSDSSAIQIDSPGTYWLDVTKDTCTVRDSIVVTVDDLPVIDLGVDTTLCAGNSLIIDATTAPAESYLWQDGSSASEFTADEAGTYQVSVINGTCSTTDSVIINYDSIPEFDLGEDRSICTGDQLTLNAFSPHATNYEWQDASTAPSLDVTTNDLFIATASNTACTFTDSVTVEINDYPVIDLGEDTILCAGEQLLLDATYPGADGYSWQDGSANPTLSASSAGWYWVDVSIGACTTRDSIEIRYRQIPAFDLGSDSVLCEGESITLDASSVFATGYSWSNGSSSPTLTVNSPGTYSATTNNPGCTFSDSITITFKTYPDIELGNDTSVCAASLVLDVSSSVADSYLWQDGSTDPDFTVSQSGLYSVQAANGHCISTDSVEVDLFSIPVFDLGDDRQLCQGESEVLNAFAASATSYVWQDASTASTLSASASGTYWATASNAACAYTDSVTLNFIQTLDFDLGNDTTLCTGTLLLLDATVNGATQYQWQDGSAAATYQVNGPGTYWVDVSVQNCIGRDSITVGYEDIPIFDMSTDINGSAVPLVLCQGESVTLDAFSPFADNYSWQDGSTDASFTATQTGMYLAVASNDHCSYTDSINLQFDEALQVDLGPDTTLCVGSTLILDAATPVATAYQWQDGSADSIFVVSASGLYHVAVSAGVCQAWDTIVANFIPGPTVELGNDTSLCWGELLTLDASHTLATDYLWNDGSTDASLDVSLTGSYAVTVSNGQCSTSDQIDIQVLQLPVVDLGGDQTLCSDQQVVLDAGGIATWQDGSSGQTFTAATSGWYAATISNGRCIGSDSAFIEILNYPVVELGADTTLCDDVTLSLQAFSPDATNYLWQDGSTTPSIDISEPGTYRVEVFNGPCSVEDFRTIDYQQSPLFDLGDDITLCEDETFTITRPTDQGVHFIWDDGSTVISRNISESGSYMLTGSNQCGTYSDDIIIEVLNCACAFHFPTGFTPNGDRYNDTFYAFPDCEGLVSFEIEIFNRWGEMVFRGTSPSDEWLGPDQTPEPLQMDTYVWVINYSWEVDGTLKKGRESGSVLLLK